MPINESLTQQIRDQARQLLEGDQVDCVIGYETGPRGSARPAFIYDPAEADRLIWSADCVHNLVTYLHDKKKPPRRGEEPPRVGVVVKPCDSRSVNVLLAEQQIERERVFLIGVACNLPESSEAFGKVVPARCARCTDRVPVIYDLLLGEPPETTLAEEDWADLARVEEMSHSERLAFWLREFDRCIRCYACRQVCPGCYCTTCMFERDDGLWVDAGIEVGQKHVFHLGRALHLAGRCVECDECERVCPMGLPLSLLNRRLVREVETLYGHRAGREEALTPLLFELGEEGSPL
ncbi:MAG: 4Fe-4S dicluster domain-containing protein [Chloroflexi bacterium]|nr:4Fe-4S dicluster domain-containing protein [Chloroflexota bacterium]